MEAYTALQEVLYLAKSMREMVGDTEPDQYLDTAFEMVEGMIDKLAPEGEGEE